MFTLRRFLFTMLALVCLTAWGQSITKYEYWLDYDVSTRVSRNTSSGNISMDLDVSALRDGMHVFNFRAMDSNGKWSAPQTTLFMKVNPQTATANKMQQYEYWLDYDVNTKKTAATADGIISMDLDVSALRDGMHVFNFRAKDVRGQWSAPQTTLFMKVNPQTATANKMQQYEYWLDYDVKTKKTAATADGIISMDLDVSALRDGMHVFNFRAKDARGQWSAPQTVLFIKPEKTFDDNKILGYQYWFNDATENMQYVSVDPCNPLNLIVELPTTNLRTTLSPDNITMVTENGKSRLGVRNLLHMRFKDANKRWSEVQTDTFTTVVDQSPVDLTAFIQNPDASEGNKGWTTSGSIGQFIQTGGRVGDPDNPYFCIGNTANNGWTAQMKQTISGLPAGTYILTATGRASEKAKLTMSAADVETEFESLGDTGGEGNGWNTQSVSFTIDGSDVDIIIKAESATSGQWVAIDDLTLTMGLQSSLTVKMPDGTNMNNFKNQKLRVSSARNTLSLTTSTEKEYTFRGLTANATYNVSLDTQYGEQIAGVSNVSIEEGENSVTLPALKPIRTVSVAVKDSTNADVTSSTGIRWYNNAGTYLAEGNSIGGMVEGSKVGYTVSLSDSLGTVYAEPDTCHYTVVAGSNNVTTRLQPLSKLTLKGKVRDDMMSLNGANVTVVQWINGKHVKTSNAATNTKGEFAIEAYDDSTRITIAYDGYYNKVITLASIAGNADLGTITLKEITGTAIQLDLSYQQCGEEERQDWYSDIDNIEFSLRNASADSLITQFSVQNGSIATYYPLSIGDKLEVTAKSRTNDFADITAQTTVTDSTVIRLPLVEKGEIAAAYTSSVNDDCVGILYDANGKLVARGSYSGYSLSFSQLEEGNYTLVSMGESMLLGNVLSLEDMKTVGLEEGTHYVSNEVSVSNGKISSVEIVDIPELDETLFYYTGTNTSFSANKSNVIVGNYVTLTTRVDFKDEYKDKVSDVSLTFDLPEGCEYVDGSAIIERTLAPVSIDGNKLTIDLPDSSYSDRVRFCVVPTKGGDYRPSASVQFSMDGTVVQPLGSAYYAVEDLSITVPSTVAKTIVPISGVATPRSSVQIFDNNVQIGETVSQADGAWALTCELNEPYNLSKHSIYVVATTSHGYEIKSQAKTCVYDKNAIETKTVTMTFYNGWLHKNVEVVFDFQTGKTSTDSYMFYTTTDITFIADLTNNDPDIVSDVVINVGTSKGESKKLKCIYDSTKDKWIATSTFTSNNLPVNLNISFDALTEAKIDSSEMDIISNDLQTAIAEINKEGEKADSIVNEMENILDDDTFNGEEMSNKMDTLYTILFPYHEDVPPIDIDEETLTKKLKAASTTEECHRIILEARQKWTTSPSEDYTKLYNGLTTPLNETIKAGVYQDVSYPEIKVVTASPIIDEAGNVNIPNSAWNLKENENSSAITFSDSKGNSIICDMTRNLSYPVTNDMEYESWKEQLTSQLSSNDSKLALGFGVIGGASQAIAEAEVARLIKEVKFDTQLYRILKDAINPNYHTLELDNIKESVKSVKSAKKVLAASKIMSGIGVGLSAAGICADAVSGVDACKKWDNIIERIKTQCTNNQEVIGSLTWEANEHKNWIRNRYVCKGSLDFGCTMFSAAGLFLGPETAGVSLVLNVASTIGSISSMVWENNFKKTDKENRKSILNQIKEKCNSPEDEGKGGNDDLYGDDNDDNDDNDDGDEDNYPFDPLRPIHDPSGYVYEAVSSNRIEGVTATCYYKEVTEDMYGDKHEKPVVWNAADYSQKNPQVTDESGLYRWDVPEGQWMVKFEKEGYETAMTDWMPVPPPQLDINVPMYHGVQPKVEKARGVESGVTVTFSKYMRPESFVDGTVSVTRNGLPETGGTLQMVNAEKEPTGDREYASKVKFVPAASFNTTDRVTITVKKAVESYCGMTMARDTTLTVPIEPEIKAIEADSVITVDYQGTKTIEVMLVPADAATGKTVCAETSSPMILSLANKEAKVDSKGKATFTLNGELPGGAALTFSMNETDVTAESKVSVVIPVTQVSAPKASVKSGAKVPEGTLVSLSTDTEGATIYYTTDGSCPCESGRKLYDTPIVVNEDVVIKAMAVKEGLDDSEIATFTYKLDDGTAIESVATDDGINVRMENGTLVVDNAQGYTCYVYTVDGKLAKCVEIGNSHFNCSTSMGVVLVQLQKDGENVKVFKVVNQE